MEEVKIKELKVELFIQGELKDEPIICRIIREFDVDLKIIEADQVTTPDIRPGTKGAVDGIIFDRSGNPREYHVLKEHPGGGKAALGLQYDRVPADAIIHWFRADRPGQSRGLPDILPALPLFAQLRRYTLAVIAAAESAANVAIFMKTSAPAGGSTWSEARR